MKIVSAVICEQEFYSRSSAAATDHVVVTPATGSLRAKKVFHLHVRKYSPKQNCMKVCPLHSRRVVKLPVIYVGGKLPVTYR